MVFPLEPAIYFPEEGGNVIAPKEFRGLGLRLEDDYFITAAGVAEKLGTSLPFEASDLERLVGSRQGQDALKAAQ